VIFYVVVMKVPDLNIVECRHCGATYWAAVPQSMAIDGGPCCFGHKLIDVAQYTSEHEAKKVYHHWQAYQRREIEKARRLVA
jgi:hypothetical protein